MSSFAGFIKFARPIYSFSLFVAGGGFIGSLAPILFALSGRADFTFLNWIILAAYSFAFAVVLSYGFFIVWPKYRRSLVKRNE